VRKPSIVLASVVLAGLAASARAETIRIDAQVPFEFTAGRNDFPAGRYQITAENPDDAALAVKNLDTGKTVVVEYLTRISSRQDGKSAFVFDAMEGKHALSEIYVAGTEEGYLLPGMGRKPHSHQQVTAQ
jgi:hypothetical protein